jgi:hypothetical protein
MSISHHVISCEVQYLVRMLWTLQLSLGYRDNFMSFHILANMSSTFTLLTKRRSAIIAVLRCRHCTHYIDINISVSTWGCTVSQKRTSTFITHDNFTPSNLPSLTIPTSSSSSVCNINGRRKIINDTDQLKVHYKLLDIDASFFMITGGTSFVQLKIKTN